MEPPRQVNSSRIGLSKSCPKCATTIPLLASVCPVCKSDISKKTTGEKRRERLLKFATFLTDWISFPAAALTAIVAAEARRYGTGVGIGHIDAQLRGRW